jgi:hypothetical protein
MNRQVHLNGTDVLRKPTGAVLPWPKFANIAGFAFFPVVFFWNFPVPNFVLQAITVLQFYQFGALVPFACTIVSGKVHTACKNSLNRGNQNA